MRTTFDESGRGTTGFGYRVRRVDLDEGDPRDFVSALRTMGGCCAWYGSGGCDAPPIVLIVGGVALAFKVFREMHQEGSPVFALACPRHADDVQRDMPPALRRSQRRELRKLLRVLGAEWSPAVDDVTVVALEDAA